MIFLLQKMQILLQKSANWKVALKLFSTPPKKKSLTKITNCTDGFFLCIFAKKVDDAVILTSQMWSHYNFYEFEKNLVQTRAF